MTSPLLLSISTRDEASALTERVGVVSREIKLLPTPIKTGVSGVLGASASMIKEKFSPKALIFPASSMARALRSWLPLLRVMVDTMEACPSLLVVPLPTRVSPL